MKFAIKSLLFTCCISAWGVLFAQPSDLYMAREYKQAYLNGTRSKDGKPGERYWQNTAHYAIDVQLNPETKSINGRETIEYTNNSPDILTTLLIRIYNDVYKHTSARNAAILPEDVIEKLDIQSLKINGERVDLSLLLKTVNGGNLQIPLNNPLDAGGKVNIEIEWSQEIPKVTNRHGYADSSAFFVAYWYPQIAAYDDVFGWDNRLGFNLVSEFYNIPAIFDVNISAPENFTVWATGTLQNEKDIFPETVLKRLEIARKTQTTTPIFTSKDYNPSYSNKIKTWKYKAMHVNDFAFAAASGYLWDAASLPIGDKQVLISSVYPPTMSDAMKDNTQNQLKALKHFSTDLPGIPYRFPAYTAFIGMRGLGGMEFPMMANNAGPSRLIAIHELFHMYFPMYVHTNEKRFAWMDEGWADFITGYTIARHFNNDSTPRVLDYSRNVQNMHGTASDVPLMVTSQLIDHFNGSYSAYHLPSFVYAILQHHLGDDLFKKCFQEYIRRWAGKSPLPYDFFYTFENVSGQNLAWLWKPWFFEWGDADIKVNSFKNGRLTLEKIGNRPLPVHVIGFNLNGDKVIDTLISASIWKNNPKQVMISLPQKNPVRLLVNRKIVDSNPLDNFFPSLSEIYKQMNVPEEMEGRYYGVDNPKQVFEIKKQDGALKMVFSGGLQSYLLPVSSLSFESLDESITVQFKNTKELIFKTGRISIQAAKK